RPVHDAGDRAGSLPRDAGGLPRDGRAFQEHAGRKEPAVADGPPFDVVQRFLRRADRGGAAVRAIPEAVSCVPAAVDDGVERQARDPVRRACRLPDRPDLLGRARHQRPAFVLPADPPGHAADPVRLHRLPAFAEPAGRPAGFVDGQPDCADGSAGVRQDACTGARGRYAGMAGAASGLRGQPAHQHDPRRKPDAAFAGRAGGAVRAQRVHPGRDLAHRFVRPVGRGTRQAAREEGDSAAAGCRRTEARPRQFHQRADPPLSRGAQGPLMSGEKISPLAGKPAPKDILVDVHKLLDAYADIRPDPSNPAQRVAFGTSGHRGSSLDGSFNEWHILAITQAICDYRAKESVTGPLFIGFDTHALSQPAFRNALEVLAANGVEVMTSKGGEFTPTPAISHAILVYNRGRESGLADGIVITPSHNPPADGGFKYNPVNGGPAGTEITRWVQKQANQYLE